MGDRQMQIGVLEARAKQELPIDRDGPFVFANADAARGIERFEEPALGLVLQELVELRARLPYLWSSMSTPAYSWRATR